MVATAIASALLARPGPVPRRNGIPPDRHSDCTNTPPIRPSASINFIPAHDGFTLRDLVSYNEKHYRSERDDNNDGDNSHSSWNHGVEVETDDVGIMLRLRQQRNFLTLLILSQGVPMLLGGDEFGRTQGGNNNAYCQDSEMSWFDWNNIDVELLEFTRHLIALRKAHPVFRRPRWFDGIPIDGSRRERSVFLPNGELMTEEHCVGAKKRTRGCLNGEPFYNHPFADPYATAAFSSSSMPP